MVKSISNNISQFGILIIVFIMFNSCKEVQKEYNLPDNYNTFINGKREGIHRYYDEEGNFRAFLKFNNDILNGEGVWYYPNGKIKSKINYVNNTEDGMAYYFYESGVIKSFRKWNKGKIVGYAVDYYDIYSRVESIMLYNDDGFLIYRKTYDEDGRLISEEGQISDTAVHNYFNNLKSGDISELFN